MINMAASNQRTTNNEPTRVAILDLGTNTFHLLIANIPKDRKPEIVVHETIAVRLGEGGISRGHLTPEAFSRGINALKRFREHIDYYKVEVVKTAATSAIRSASNGIEFLSNIKTETGLTIEIIDGEREAELIYQGVRAAINIKNNSLIVDIGGGSVEFIICDKDNIIWKKSYPIGAARLMSQFHHNDPISRAEIKNLTSYLDETLRELQQQMDIHKPELMIGSAGSFETFAGLQDHKFKASFDEPEYEIDLEGFSRIAKQVMESNHKDRQKMTAIPEVRVDMIVVSTILTDYVIQKSGIKTLKLSCHSLKEGILFDMLA